jgi:hypothetical protein
MAPTLVPAPCQAVATPDDTGWFLGCWHKPRCVCEPETKNVQKPHIERLAVEKTLAIPDGGTALIHCGRMTVAGRNEYGPPVLSKIPYVNRLFKNVGYGRETRTS